MYVTQSPDAKAKDGRGQQASRGHGSRFPSRLNEQLSVLSSRAPFGDITEVFPVIFPHL